LKSTERRDAMLTVEVVDEPTIPVLAIMKIG
jgi:hypothetical protein